MKTLLIGMAAVLTIGSAWGQEAKKKYTIADVDQMAFPVTTEEAEASLPPRSPAMGWVSRRVQAVLASSQPITIVVVAGDGTASLAAAESNAVMDLLAKFNGQVGFSVVERARLDRVLSETRLTYGGIVADGVEPGKLLGVNHILFIAERKFMDRTEIEYKLVEVKTAKILALAKDNR